MFKLTIILAVMLTMVAMMSFAAHFLPLRKMKYEKASPYECGFDPLKSARVPFSFRFFLVAMLFLLFDLEMALLFPFPSFKTLKDPSYATLLAVAFLTILILGLIFEWLQGGLDWAE